MSVTAVATEIAVPTSDFPTVDVDDMAVEGLSGGGEGIWRVKGVMLRWELAREKVDEAMDRLGKSSTTGLRSIMAEIL